MIETGEWKGAYYAWESIGFGCANAAKSIESIDDAKKKLDTGDSKEIFMGILEPYEEVHSVAGGFEHMYYKDCDELDPVFDKNRFVRSVAIKLEESE